VRRRRSSDAAQRVTEMQRWRRQRRGASTGKQRCGRRGEAKGEAERRRGAKPEIKEAFHQHDKKGGQTVWKRMGLAFTCARSAMCLGLKLSGGFGRAEPRGKLRGCGAVPSTDILCSFRCHDEKDRQIATSPSG
jgi:hypothetical protein